MWLPASHEQALKDARAKYERAVLAGLQLASELEGWNRDLRLIDPRVQMVRADPEATHPALKPGFYHLIRDNAGFPPTVLVVGARDGRLVLDGAGRRADVAFCEPTSQVFDALKRSDMWSGRSERERLRRQRKLEDAERSRQERERNERAAEIRDRVKAAFFPGVSMSRAGAWTNRARAPKPKRGG